LNNQQQNYRECRRTIQDWLTQPSATEFLETLRYEVGLSLAEIISMILRMEELGTDEFMSLVEHDEFMSLVEKKRIIKKRKKLKIKKTKESD